jgi:hypothetical protein
VTARLLVRHQGRPEFIGVEIVTALVEQRLRVGFQQTRREALADQPALPIAAIRVEAVTHHGLAVAHDIGNDGDKARRHLREIDVGVSNWRGDRLRNFADVEDTN